MRVYFLTVFCFLGGVLAVDEHILKKLPCFVPTTANVDLTWFNSVKMWFNPMTNKMDIYRMCRELLRVKAEEIPEYDIYYDACTTYHPYPKGDGFTIKGFDGYETRVKRTPSVDKPGVMRIMTDSSDYKLGINGTSTIIQTDNKNYVMLAICDRNVMVWKVWSITPKLDPSVVLNVFNTAGSLGFYRENFVMIKYDFCPNQMRAG